MAGNMKCASCSSKDNLKQCTRCKLVSYCGAACQRADRKTHKAVCVFRIVRSPQTATPNDPLSHLRSMPDAETTTTSHTRMSQLVTEIFKVAELRMAIFSLLPALDLLKVQGVCRSWYRTVTLELSLQQRVFFAAGPGPLIFPAMKGNEAQMCIEPRTRSQVDHTKMCKRPMWGGGSLHQIQTDSGTMKEVEAVELEKDGMPIILNPFFTSLWLQDPTNMTLSPHITVPTTVKAASWRRMQVTSPPLMQADSQIWYSGKVTGKQLLPSTGRVPTGVTLGDVADVLADQPKRDVTLHWILIMSSAWWLRSADAVVVPPEGEVGGDSSEHTARPAV